MAKQLSTRESLFIQYYIESEMSDDSAADAARKAGYAEKGIYVAAHRLLKKPAIRAAIEKSRKKVSDKLEVNRERILKGLLDIFDGEEKIVVDGVPLAFEGELLTQKSKASDRINAAAQINKMQGFYASEKVEHEHSGQISCVLLLPSNDREVK